MYITPFRGVTPSSARDEARQGTRARQMPQCANVDPGAACAPDVRCELEMPLALPASAKGTGAPAPAVPANGIAEHATLPTRAARAALHGEFATLDGTRKAFAATMRAAAARHGLEPPRIAMAMRLVARGTSAMRVIDAVPARMGCATTREQAAAAPGSGC